MGLSANEFVERLNAIKASAKAGETTPEIDAGLHSLTALLKKTWTPEELKAALAAHTPVPTPLEEALTTLSMEWSSRRGRTE